MSISKKTRAQLIFELETLRQRVLELEKVDADHKIMKKSQFEDQHLLQIFMHNIPDAIYFKDTEGKFIRINKAQAIRLGLKETKEAIGKSDFDFFSAADAERAKAEDQMVIRSAKVSQNERKKFFPDGKEGWVSATKVPFPDTNGNIIGVFGLTRDITERKIAESELRKSRNKLKNAKRETDNILRNVEEGLFILDDKYAIGSQYSAALENILDEKKLNGKNILDVLKDKLINNELPVIEEYLELMFEKKIDEESVNDLNPLSNIELKFSHRNGIPDEKKFLSFKFRRIFQKEKIIGLIATVNDMTEQVILAQKLKESEAQSKRKMDWLFSILHVEPQLLREFIESVQNELELINQILKSDNSHSDLSDVLDSIYRSIHLIKGNASLLNIKFFAEKAHNFEEEIEGLKKQVGLQPADLISLVYQVGEIDQYLQELNNLIDKLSQIKENFRPKRSYENKVLVQSIGNLITNLASELQKEILFVHTDFKGDDIPGKYWLLVKDILIQLVRNSLIHGIENPDERKKLKKKTTGVIEISTFLNNGYFELTYRDDGRGIQFDKLLRKASNLKRWPESELKSWNHDKIAEIIYEPGISTSDNPNLISGRGMGMDSIRKKVVAQGGQIVLDSKEGKFISFNIKLPLYL